MTSNSQLGALESDREKDRILTRTSNPKRRTQTLTRSFNDDSISFRS